ncbi:MAG: L-2-amino-thiazoline-4-carboxylic acid hydrolase [Desulfovermiculus sp.]
MEEQAPQTIDKEEARQALASVSRRIALLHLAYAKAIINELGQEQGTRLISEAIKDYAVKIGEKTRAEVVAQGYEPSPENFEQGKSYALPKFPGMHLAWETVEGEDGTKRMRAHGCILGEVWKEYEEEKIGRLYCYMDTAKYMGYNPYYKLKHHKAVPDGDEYCEFEIENTTPEEREDFSTPGRDWFFMDH